MTDWTDDDVARVAYCFWKRMAPPSDVLERYGEHPPDDFLRAVGKRVIEIVEAEFEDYQ